MLNETVEAVTVVPSERLQQRPSSKLEKYSHFREGTVEIERLTDQRAFSGSGSPAKYGGCGAATGSHHVRSC